MYGKCISIHAPSRERQPSAAVFSAVACISIHAPSRERPWTRLPTTPAAAISIHAPSRERQLRTGCPHRLHCYFNPRSLTGATSRQLCHLLTQTISIHAPSRERHLCFITLIFKLHFNPRSLTGATRVEAAVTADEVFQSTLPHGSDIAAK